MQKHMGSIKQKKLTCGSQSKKWGKRRNQSRT